MSLARWVPRLVRERLATADRRRGGDAGEALEVAALWLDISGFTPLTRRFAEQGSRGAEIVSGILDRCYGALTELITDAGGDLVDFAGDGILAIWPAAESGSLAVAVRRAADCAAEVQRRLDRFPAAEGVELRFYAGVGAGAVALFEVGGVGGQWRALIAGAPLQQLGGLKARCGAGEVVRSAEAEALLREAGEAPLDAPGDTVRPTPPASDEAALRAYVVDTVLRRIDAGQTEWLAEFRLASVLFVVVPAPDVTTAAGRAAVREGVRAAQESIAALDGSFNQVMMDDTGLVVLAAWGVPDHTHEDDARRALQAGQAIRERLVAAGFAPRIGVATGRVFCGACGNAVRSRYAFVGAAVNRAARIAMASPHGVRCDGRTREGADRWFRFGEPESLALKGLPEPVAMYATAGVRGSEDERPGGAVSGRERERATIAEALRAPAGASDGPPLLLIEGEAGIGKSVLLRHLAGEARRSGRRLLVGAADAVERSTPYFPWREPFRDLLEVGAGATPAEARQRVAERLRPLVGRVERIPLLEPVLGLGLSDTPETAAMAGADRGVATRELLADVVDLLAGPAPVVLLDDLHWFDSASLELIMAIRDRVPRALLAGATRPPGDESPPQLLALLARTGTVRVPLVEMSGAEVLGMVRSALQVVEVPPALAEFLVARGEGHPLFTMELALLLREMGVVTVERGRCAFDPADARLAALSFSEKSEGVVATRIDRLDPSHQLALKVASVVGRAFEYRVVRGIYPIASEREAVRRLLDDLTQPRLIEVERPDPMLAYLFRHVIIREVAYGLVSFAQRRLLHAGVARELEASPEADLTGNLPLLAHHWLMAEESGRALDYLERAGNEALRRGAGREAFRFFQDAFALAEREGARIPSVNAIRLAELERLTGEAVEQMLDVPGSSQWMTRALARLGFSVHDATSPGRRWEMLRQVARQAGHLVWPATLRPRPRAESAEALELAARAYGTLAEHAYFESDLAGMLLFSLTSVNLAERARRPVAAERSYVSLAHTAGLMGLTPLVDRYRARSAATTLGRNMSLREIEYAGRMLARGRFDEAAAAGERTAAIANRYADRHHEAQGWGAVASARLRQGWPDKAVEAAERIYPTGRTDWALAAQCNASVLSGRPGDAMARYAAIDEWEPAFALSHRTIRALWAEERGDHAALPARVEDALRELEGPGLKNAFTTGHYGNLLALLSRWYHRLGVDAAAAREDVVVRIGRVARELARHARLFHIGRPRLHQANAMLALHAGRVTAGRRQLARGLRVAERFGMAPEIVALHMESARWRMPGAPAAIARAVALCRERGMDRLLREVEAVPLSP